MAVGTAIMAGVAVVGATAKIIDGAKQKKNAKRAAKRFRRQSLQNVNRDRKIGTRAEDFALEEQQRATATTVDALRSGGIRGSVGGVGEVQRANNENAFAIGADIDEQQIQLDREMAQDEANMRSIQENRDNQELSAIQAQMNAGNQQVWSGIGDIAQVGMSVGSNISGTKGTGTKTE